MYFSIASASLSRMRFAIGERAEAGLEGAAKDEPFEGPVGGAKVEP